MSIVGPSTPNTNPSQPNPVPVFQITIALACALLIAQTVDWATAAHVLLAILTVFTSANRAAPPTRHCTHCGHRL
jgi:hypothetical protein